MDVFENGVYHQHRFHDVHMDPIFQVWHVGVSENYGKPL